MQVALTRRVVLGGLLAAEFAPVYNLAVRSAAEAVRSLCIQLPNFKKRIAAGEWHVILKKKNGKIYDLGEVSHLQLNLGRGDLYILPAVRGSGPTARIIIGSALIVAAVVLSIPSGGLSAALIPGISLVTYGTVATIGLTLALSGVSQLLAPQPTTSSLGESPLNNLSKSASLKSDIFSSPQNVSTQGIPVPLCYGRYLLGSNIVSVGISTIRNGISGTPSLTPSGTSLQYLSGAVRIGKVNLGLSPAFTDMPFGIENANRYIILPVQYYGGGAKPSSVTIGGVTATEVTNSYRLNDFFMVTVFYIANVPTGLTGTIQFNWASQVQEAIHFGIYSAIGINPVPSSMSSARESVVATVPVDGFVIASKIAASLQDKDTASITWKNVTGNRLAQMVMTGDSRPVCGAVGSKMNTATSTLTSVVTGRETRLNGDPNDPKQSISVGAWGPA